MTIVVEKAMLIISPRATFDGSITFASFVTGTVSPVSADSSIFKLYEEISLQSAGTKLPASSSIISPGTSRVLSIVIVFPFLNTLEVGEESFFSASRDFSALLSCITPISALITTITTIIIESVYSLVPSKYETIADTKAAISKIIIIKSLN